MSDRLAKSFDIHLFEAVGNDRHLRRRLTERGWKQFVSGEHPDTPDPGVMAAAALCYLGLDHDSLWCDEVFLLKGIFAFLRTERGEPSRSIGELAAILKNGPVDPLAVQDWFQLAYPP